MNPLAKLEAYADTLDGQKVQVNGAGHFDPASGVRELPLPYDFFTD